jgi:hypothetical protein
MSLVINRIEAESRGAQVVPFRDAFCALRGCPPDAYEEEMFRASLYPHARLFAGMIRRLRPTFFREDFDIVRELAWVNSPAIFQSEVNRFHGRNVRCRNLLRTALLIRISGKRLMRWKDRAFPD